MVILGPKKFDNFFERFPSFLKADNLVDQGLYNSRSAIYQMAIFSHLIREMDGSSLILAHTNELLHQSKDKLEMIGPYLDVENAQINLCRDYQNYAKVQEKE